VELVAAFPHTHTYGKREVVTRVGGALDGQQVAAWDQTWTSPGNVFSPRVTLEPGEGLHVECDYENDTSQALTYGIRGEMCGVGGYYLPYAGALVGTEEGQGCVVHVEH
jgi:hypothetical protein